MPKLPEEEKQEYQKENILSQITQKKGVVIFGIILMVILALVYFLFSTSQKRVTIEPDEAIVEEEVMEPAQTGYKVSDELSKKRIAQEMLDYIQTQYRSDGYYNYLSHFEDSCDITDPVKCTQSLDKSYPTSNAWAALAYLGGYQILGEQKYLSLATRDILKVKDYCTNNPQNCLWVIWQIEKVYEINKDPQILELLNTLGPVLLSSGPNDNLMLLATEVRELAGLYKITGDQRYLDEATNRLSLAKSSFNKEHAIYQKMENQFTNYACWFTTGSLELAKITNDDKETADVRIFITQADIPNNYFYFQYPLQFQPCLETYYMLYDKNGLKKYYDNFTSLTELFLDAAFDSAQNKHLYGEGGIIFNLMPQPQGQESQNLVNITDTSYMVYLLSLL